MAGMALLQQLQIRNNKLATLTKLSWPAVGGDKMLTIFEDFIQY